MATFTIASSSSARACSSPPTWTGSKPASRINRSVTSRASSSDAYRLLGATRCWSIWSYRAAKLTLNAFATGPPTIDFTSCASDLYARLRPADSLVASIAADPRDCVPCPLPATGEPAADVSPADDGDVHALLQPIAAASPQAPGTRGRYGHAARANVAVAVLRSSASLGVSVPEAELKGAEHGDRRTAGTNCLGGPAAGGEWRARVRQQRHRQLPGDLGVPSATGGRQDEPGGAARRQPRHLLRDGAQRHAGQGQPAAAVGGHRDGLAGPQGGRRVPGHQLGARGDGRGARSRPGQVPGGRRAGGAGLPHFQRPPQQPADHGEGDPGSLTVAVKCGESGTPGARSVRAAQRRSPSRSAGWSGASRRPRPPSAPAPPRGSA